MYKRQELKAAKLSNPRRRKRKRRLIPDNIPTETIDNNFAERAMRPIAIGRKNWLFVGSEQAGHRAAVLTSLIASCKNNFVEPWAYLKDVFTKMSQPTSSDELAALLPDRWLQENPDKRWDIAQTRKNERQNKT